MSANFQPGYVILGGVLLFRMTRLSSVELELRRWPEYARVNAVASIRTGATIRSIQTLNSTCVCLLGLLSSLESLCSTQKPRPEPPSARERVCGAWTPESHLSRAILAVNSVSLDTGANTHFSLSIT